MKGLLCRTSTYICLFSSAMTGGNYKFNHVCLHISLRKAPPTPTMFQIFLQIFFFVPAVLLVLRTPDQCLVPLGKGSQGPLTQGYWKRLIILKRSSCQSMERFQLEMATHQLHTNCNSLKSRSVDLIAGVCTCSAVRDDVIGTTTTPLHRDFFGLICNLYGVLQLPKYLHAPYLAALGLSTCTYICDTLQDQ